MVPHKKNLKPMKLTNSNKSLRTIFDDIYNWSIKSGVAAVCENARKIQCDKVIEELNELLYHCHYNYCKPNFEESIVDDFGDIFIATVSLINISFGKVKDGYYQQHEALMDEFYDAIKLKEKVVFCGYKDIRDNIFDAIAFVYTIKNNDNYVNINHRLCQLFTHLVDLFKDVASTFALKMTIKQCICEAFKEIQDRRYTIKVR